MTISLKQLRVFFLCSTTILTFGLSLYIDSYTSPIEDKILNEGILDKTSYPVFASILSLGAIIGSLVAGPLTEWVGIKSTLIFASPLAVIGGFVCVVAWDPISLILARIAIGIQVGITNSSIPIYNSEIAPPSKRKLYGSVLGLSLRLGTTVAYLLGIWMGFRWLAVIHIASLLILITALTYQPESPRWIHSKGNIVRAIRTTAYLHDICEDLADNLVHEKENPPKHDTVADFMHFYCVKPVIKPLLICCTIQIFKESSAQQLLMLYAAHILEQGVSINPEVAALFNILSQVLGSVLFLWVIKQVPWKKLLIITTAMQALFNVLLGLNLYLSINHFQCQRNIDSYTTCSVLMNAPLFLTSILSCSYGVGWGSLVWWLYGEILHKRYARVSAGIATFCTYTAAFLNQLIAPILVNYFGSYVVFLGYGFVCLLGLSLQLYY